MRRTPEPPDVWARPEAAHRPVVGVPVWPPVPPGRLHVPAGVHGPLSLRSVPDGRGPVPARWWLPVLALLMLGSTTVALLISTSLSARLGYVALGTNLVGYLLVRWRIRPARLRRTPPVLTPPGWAPLDLRDPPTQVIPVVGVTPVSTLRRHLLGAALAAMGLSGAWAVAFALVTRSRTAPSTMHFRRSASIGGAALRAVVNSVATSILEECGIAVLILSVAALATAHLRRSFDARLPAVLAIAAGTLVRTALHIPLWGFAALGRFGLSLVLAWLFWRTRRIWPLIVAHVLWDSLSLTAATSPSLTLNSLCGLLVLGWVVTGLVLGILALVRSRAEAGGIRAAAVRVSGRAGPG